VCFYVDVCALVSLTYALILGDIGSEVRALCAFV